MIIRLIAAIGTVILILGILVTGITVAATHVTVHGWRELLNRSPVRIFTMDGDLGPRVREFEVSVIEREPIYRPWRDFSVRVDDWRIIIDLRDRTIIIG